MGRKRENEPSETAPFQRVDWSSVDGGRELGAELLTFVGASLLLGTLFAFDVFVRAGSPTFGFWDVSRLDWLTMVAAAIVLAYGVVPAVRNADRVVGFARRYPREPLSLAALAWVVLLGVVGAIGPLVLAQPELDFSRARQPPAFTTVSMNFIVTCVGPVVENQCHGTLEHPLGTTRAGESMLVWLVYGARTAVQFAVVSTAIMAPIAIVVGTTTAYFGGRVEALATRVLELQEAIPTFIVYFLLVMFVGPTLFVLVAVYGLFNWSGMALQIRQAARSEKERPYIRAARSAGASPLSVIRRHLVPNTAETLVTQVTLMIPKLILVEALFSYLGLSGDQSFSWGQLIQRGLKWLGGSVDSLEGVWWVALLPTVAIALTVVALNVVGDGIQSAYEPRER